MVGFKCFLLSAFPALAIMHHDRTESPFCHRYYRYKKSSMNYRRKTNKNSASCGGLFNIFVNFSCFMYQQLIDYQKN